VYVPTGATLRRGLQEKRALVVLDDVGLERAELETVLDAAPACTFVWTCGGRLAAGEAVGLRLRGLPLDDALRLLERELGRPLAADEAPLAGALCDALEGHPLRLLQAAAAVRDEGATLAGAAAKAGGTREKDAAAFLPPPGARRRVLATVAAFSGAPVRAACVADLSGVATAEDELIALARGSLLQGGERGFVAPAPLAEALADEVAPFREAVLGHCAAWAEARHDDPAAVATDAEPLLAVLEWAAAERRWDGVLRLGRALEGPLALAGRVDAWERVLALIEEAARQNEDRAAAAYALHQRGTRAACLGWPEAATLLREALGLRHGLGDAAGAAATRHNLDALFPPAGGGEDERDDPSREPDTPAGPSATAKLVAAAAGAVVLGLLAVAMSGSPRPEAPAPPAAAPAPAPVQAAEPDPPLAAAAPAAVLPDTQAPKAEPTPPVTSPPSTRPSRQAASVSGPVPEISLQTPQVTPPAEVLTGPQDPVVTPPADESERTVLVRNERGSMVQIRDVAIAGAYAGDFRIVRNECEGRLLRPWSQCRVVWVYEPNAPRTREAELVVRTGQPIGVERYILPSGARSW
ncbi:MAG TPA: hypothetical protein VFX98_18505, partial [Longimicrobiaceae bacterium]|nr:hypothetical protein [Longimicrobiaceae bacterium]